MSAVHWVAALRGYLPAYLPTGELYLNAPPDPETGEPDAGNLAKAYLWLSAASRRLQDEHDLARARTLLDQVRAIMPATWAPDLDAKVEVHLAGVAAVR